MSPIDSVRDRSICVIGAGPSGIAAAKALLDQGVNDLTIYDRGRIVGGNWVFDAETGHSSVFETTHIISSKAFSQYEDFPLPESYPDFPSHRQLAAYFQAYAEKFSINRFITFQTTVESCELTDDGRWEVTINQEAERSTRYFDELVVCNGHHWKPRWPDYVNDFAGTLSHSHDFKRLEPFRNKQVLVIGGGNSACDVAVETARVSARTDISWRRGYWILPKLILGLPSDHIYYFVNRNLPWLPLGIRLRLLQAFLRFITGGHQLYGLKEPDHPFGATHPTINSELLYSLRHGKVTPRSDIDYIQGNRVYFDDGTFDHYDHIVACTGYDICHPFFKRSFIDYSCGPVPLYLKMIHPEYSNLHFIGLFQPLGCIWPLAELQAKIMARRMTGEWRAPADIKEAIEHELANPDIQQLQTARHTITVDPVKFADRLRKELLNTTPLIGAN